MKPFDSVDAVLDFAIAREQEAFDFYHELARKTTNTAMAHLLTGFAAEEAAHKRKLEAVKEGEIYLSVRNETPDLKISDYLVNVEPSPDMDFQESLIVAMKREKAAFALYTDMAAETGDSSLSEIFNSLAQEEAKHKLRFELVYEHTFMKEN
jgi:rubrerythrin